MGNYIINPTWVYLLGVVSVIKPVLLALSMTVGIFTIIKVVCIEDYTTKSCIIYFVFIAIFLLLYIFIPEKDTLVAIKIIQCATHGNTEIDLESIKQAVNYVCREINQLR